MPLDGAVATQRKAPQLPPPTKQCFGGGDIFGAFRHALTAAATNDTVNTRVSGVNTGLHSAVGSGSGSGSSRSSRASRHTVRT